MSQLADVQKFNELAKAVASPSDLHRLMQEISREMGFDHFALVHHVDLRPRGTLVDHLVTRDFMALTDYPQAWIEEYIENKIVSNDPVLLASQRTMAGFAWSKIPKIIKMTSAHRELTERTRQAGICDGFTVPAHVPGEMIGSCNFAVGPTHSPPEDNFMMAQLIGAFAFEGGRQLVARMRDIQDASPVKLTQRQMECIVLVAKGKSDWEIGKILGLSPETVASYIKSARERYDVPARIQVVLRACFDGTIPLSELF
ncbi:MAG: LuxR family transcriptional regulator [Novosphingobium sp.]